MLFDTLSTLRLLIVTLATAERFAPLALLFCLWV